MNKDRQEQKMLHEQYMKEMVKVWGEDDGMAKYCTNHAVRIIETIDGKLITIDKPRIRKDFCFGYSCSKYDTEEYDEANRMVEHAFSSELYFIRQNLKEMKEMLRCLKAARNGKQYRVYMYINYYSSPADTKAYGWGIIRLHEEFRERDVKERGYRDMDMETLDRLITGYKMEIIAFHKKLRSYLKKYGLSKVNAWSYWRDE